MFLARLANGFQKSVRNPKAVLVFSRRVDLCSHFAHLCKKVDDISCFRLSSLERKFVVLIRSFAYRPSQSRYHQGRR